MPDIVLRIVGLKVAYGGIQAVKGVDLEIQAGELVTLIGANGAGKTSTLKAITGTQAWAGEIDYMGQPTRGMASYQLLAARARDGAGRPRRLRAHERHREPADGRLRAQRQGGDHSATSTKCSRSSRA